MSITLTMIGTGSAFSKSFYNNNALVECGGQKMLVDCGYTAPRALHELGISPLQIDAYFITHLHADHIGGLEEIAFRHKFEFNRKPRLVVPAVLRGPLWEYSLRGGLEDPSESAYSLDDYFDVTVIDDLQSHEIISGLSVELLPTQHIPGKPCFGLYMNGYLYYSADSCFDPFRLEDLVRNRGCRYILHDCQLTGPPAVHASLDQLLTLPLEIQEKIRLMHYNDRLADFIGKSGQMTFLHQHISYEFAPATIENRP